MEAHYPCKRYRGFWLERRPSGLWYFFLDVGDRTWGPYESEARAKRIIEWRRSSGHSTN